MKNSLPEHVNKYAETPIFTNETVPKKLTELHDTKKNTWGKLLIHKGALDYIIPGPPAESVHVAKGSFAIIEPQVLHHVKLTERVEFSIEFYR